MLQTIYDLKLPLSYIISEVMTSLRIYNNVKNTAPDFKNVFIVKQYLLWTETVNTNKVHA